MPTAPDKIEGIAVGKKCLQLHFLQGTGWGSPGALADGTKIGTYIVRYEDKSSQEIPIVYGEDVRDWWDWDDSQATTNAKIAWTGKNEAASTFRADREIPIRLYLRSWMNPHPDKAIKSIDFVSTNDTISAPFCVAISLETEPVKGKADEKK